jgi:hypothetical protein
MEIRKPDYIQKKYTVSIKYMCNRLGIEYNTNDINIKTINFYFDEDDDMPKVDIWTTQEIKEANAFP